MVKKKEQQTGIRKHSEGRPTVYQEGYSEQAYKLCSEFGADDKKLAKFFNVTERTINNWKRKYTEFFQSLKKGKAEFDTQVVEQSLLKRALGYIYDEITQEPDKDGKLRITKIVTKQVAPEVVAQIFWLKNRDPARWSDKKAIDHRVEGVTKPLTEEELMERLQKIKDTEPGIDYKSIEGSRKTP